MSSRLFAIGDIHGCNVALKALIEAIAPKAEDTIVVLGDVIDWGPDSRDCVRQLLTDILQPSDGSQGVLTKAVRVCAEGCVRTSAIL